MKWLRTSYNTETAGDYAVTAHAGEPGVFYIAWHRQQELGTYATGEEAKARCVAEAAK